MKTIQARRHAHPPALMGMPANRETHPSSRLFLICSFLLLMSSPALSQLPEWSGEIGYSSTVSDITKEDIARRIDIDGLVHPYLYFSEEDKPAMLERIENDPELKRIMDGLMAEAFKLLHQPVRFDIPVQGRNTRGRWTDEDRSSEYMSHYYTNRENAFKLAFIFQMTGEEKYAAKAFEFADAFCDLPTWTGRAHEFPIIYPRIWPWNVDDDQVNFSFDHWNGDSARIMAAVYDWLYPALNKAQRDRIRGALLENAITRVRGHYDQHWWATSYRCNWTAVNNSGLGLAALTLLKEHPEFMDVVAESYNRINKVLSELGVDGAWQEGGSYWRYGVHTASFFADALKRATNNHFNLFENERFAGNPVTFPLHISLPGGGSLNFEDSGSATIGPSYLFSKIAAETRSGEAGWYRNEKFERGTNIFDIIWPMPDIEPTLPDQPSIHFRTWDWWVMRSDFTDPSKVLVAGKAGRNNDPHHGHLDVGHFVVHWNNEFYIRDLGISGYDQIYFNEERWTHYPNALSDGHNVVFVNGEKQIPGKRKDSEWDHSIGGWVVEFRTDKDRDYVLKDAANAYPKKEMKGWRRHVLLDKPETTLVLDEVTSSRGAEIEVRFHPGVDARINDNMVMLAGKEGLMALITITDTPFEIRPGVHAIQIVQGDRSLEWESYFGTVLQAQREKTDIATLILPVVDEKEAHSIANSASIRRHGSDGLVLSFTKEGKTNDYHFRSNPDGWVLR